MAINTSKRTMTVYEAWQNQLDYENKLLSQVEKGSGAYLIHLNNASGIKKMMQGMTIKFASNFCEANVVRMD